MGSRVGAGKQLCGQYCPLLRIFHREFTLHGATGWGTGRYDDLRIEALTPYRLPRPAGGHVVCVFGSRALWSIQDLVARGQPQLIDKRLH